MRRLIFVLLFGTLFSYVPTSGQASRQSPTNAGSSEQDVIAAEAKWLDALYHADLAALDSSESGDFVLITPTGMITKQDHLTLMKQRLSNGPRNSTTYSLAQQKVSIYGPIAVVTDTLTITNAGDYPITSPGHYWQTEIWHNEANQWKLVHLHMSLVARQRM
jgi:ketosteroid isomerase-like protein